MDTRSLQLFLTLADSLSFTRTAELRHLSLSAVSRSLQRIEEEVGQRLVERDKRSVRLTREGERFRSYAQSGVDDWQQVLGELRLDKTNLRGEISVYCSVTASYSVLSPILEGFRQAYPGIDIMLHTGDQADAISRIRSGQDDICVAARPDDLPRKLQFLTLQLSPLRFIAPDFPCAVADQVAQLDPTAETFSWGDIPFIVAERGLSKERLDQWFRVRGERPRVYAQVAGHEAIAAMVGLGLGVGLVPELVLANSAYLAKLQVVTPLLPLQDFPVGLCGQAQRLENPLVAAFWELAQRSYPAAI
jgi:LysR family positive regulator for ilvC